MLPKCEICDIKSKAASKLSEEEIAKLSLNCVYTNFHKGDCVIKQGVFSTNVAYLKSGLAKIHVIGPYHEQIVRIVKAPSYLGLPTTFGDKINQYSVTVISNAEVCFVDLNTFLHLLKVNSGFAHEIIIDVCKNELEAFYRCANRTQKQVRGKIADVLLEFSDRIYNSDVFILPLSQAEIGNLVDASRESVSRILTEFDNDQIISIKNKKIEIINKKTLLMISANG